MGLWQVRSVCAGDGPAASRGLRPAALSQVRGSLRGHSCWLVCFVRRSPVPSGLCLHGPYP